MFLRADGTYAEILPDCDGSDPSVISDRSCEVPLAKLTDPSSFNLEQGATVVVKVRATNVQGLTSVYSNPSSSPTLIVAVPEDPAAAPIRNEAMSSRSVI